ncbi:hypothetical protein [Aquisphaera insulae]|uniref:hypothetical protein n=1 Tax=Aquisphaera insulae TaxID=2712864 RepID=UPI0013EABFB5|nr:hypothetical protein [Aquisphaera insulae]
MASRTGGCEHARRVRFGRVLSLMLGLAAGSARAQDGPPLEPPIAGPATTPAPKPAEPAIPAAPASKPEERRPLLVIPGVTAPVPPRPDRPSPAGTQRPPAVEVSSPALTGPATASRPPIVLSLEPIDEEEARIEEKKTRITKPRPPQAADVPARDSSPAPARPEGFLSRFFAPPGGHATPKAAGSAITVEPRSDPAAESAVKRRVEGQVRQELGDRLQSVEVRVVGRTVNISAKASYFWQRRSVRRALESLQLPAGYRVRVERVD